MQGFKVTDVRGCGRNDFQYEVGKTYIHEGKVEPCSSGLHYCPKIVDCLNYRRYIQPGWRYFRVTDLSTSGKRKVDNDKVATDVLRIDEELTADEFQKLCDERFWKTTKKPPTVAQFGILGVFSFIAGYVALAILKRK